MKSSLLYIPLIYILLHEADCMKCLRCNGVLNPLLCDRIKICDQTEICMSVQYLTGNKETLYNVGCFPKNSCVNGTIGPPVHTNPNAEAAHLDPDDQILCSYCCKGDTCNHASCGNDGFVLSRGPICYDCPQTTDPSSCSFVRTCEDGEVCRLHEQNQLGLTFYTTSCSIKSDCQMKDDNIFGRRRRSIERTECCDSDLCNGRTTVSQTSQTSSTMTSTIKTTLPRRRYRDCKDWRLLAVASSGVYDIYPDGKTRITVYCDQVTDGGGWTVVLSRNKIFNGGRLWEDYKRGFGDVHGLYWLGNENIHLLTANKTSAVYFKMMSTDGTWYYATYKNASVGPESDGYRFHVDVRSYKGNAGNSIDQQYGRMDGIQFSTIDKDNDLAANNCATDYGGGWWFDSCEFICMSVKYLTGNKETLYNVGCFPRNSCVNGTIGPPVHTNPNAGTAHLDPDDQILCSYCCQGDSCNHATCGNEGFVLSRGPICYNCPQTTDPSSCSFVRTCEDGEVCRLHQQSQLGITFFSTSCSIKSDCHIRNENIFGRRRRRGVLERTECCTSDLCNGRKNGSQTTSASTMVSTFKTTRPPRRYRDCKEWRFLVGGSTGVYDIYPDGRTRITVFCDMVTDGGGWTVVLSRNKTFNGSRLWKDYKNGFGDVHGLYWLGNEYIHLLTANTTNAVYFNMMSTNGTWYYATYKNASVGPESDGYRFHADVRSYKGDAGNAIDRKYGRMNGIRFSTVDQDNDLTDINCAHDLRGGWWFDSCAYVCLTCTYNFEWRFNVGNPQSTTMMFRRT